MAILFTHSSNVLTIMVLSYQVLELITLKKPWMKLCQFQVLNTWITVLVTNLTVRWSPQQVGTKKCLTSIDSGPSTIRWFTQTIHLLDLSSWQILMKTWRCQSMSQPTACVKVKSKSIATTTMVQVSNISRWEPMISWQQFNAWRLVVLSS